MRLPAAVAFLVQSLPVQSSQVGASSLGSHHRPIEDILLPQGGNHRRWQDLDKAYGKKLGKVGGIRSKRLRRLSLNGGQLRLKNAPGRECDPLQPSDGSDALLGILTCSMGQYCVESKESSLGGYCVEPLGHMESRKLQEYGSSNMTLFESNYEHFCVENDLCNCTNIDRDAYTLDVACPLSEEVCYDVYSECQVNLTMCVEFDYTYSMRGLDEFKTSICAEHSKPYYQRVCYDVTVVDNITAGCSVEFNGVTCNSCEIVPTDYNGNTLQCYVFDCTNTPGNFSGTDCQVQADRIYTTYRETYGCAENCSLCGEGLEMTKPSQVINVSFASGKIYQFECDFVSYIGQSTFVSEAECERLSKITFEPCGCSDGLIATAPPSASTVETSTNVPPPSVQTETDAPSSVSVDGTTSDASSASCLNQNDLSKYSIIGLLTMGITLAASVTASP